MSDSLRPHGLQHTRLPCPSLSPGVCLNSYLLSQWCYLTISSSAAPLLFPSIRVFPRLALHIRWPKQWSFSFSINPSNEYSGLISFRVDRFDLLAVQGILNNLLQQHGSKASVVQCSAFFIQLSYLYMTTGKTIALTTWTFVGKVMPLLFNTLSRFAIAFLPRSKRLLISWLQSPFTIILAPKKIKSVTGFHFFPIYLCWGPEWGTPPVTKVMRKEARHTQRRDRASGVPLEILERLPP